MHSHINDYLQDAAIIISKINKDDIDRLVNILLDVRKGGGRLFFIGVGGSAANCSHAVNDFRKIAGLEAYAAVDNVAELTARSNDEGWATVFSEWLKSSNLTNKDAVFVFSVGGGSREKNISANIVYALDYAKKQSARVIGVVGRDGGYTAKVADGCIIIPLVNPDRVTALTEAFQGVILHLLVSDPRLMVSKNKWESMQSDKKLKGA